MGNPQNQPLQRPIRTEKEEIELLIHDGDGLVGNEAAEVIALGRRIIKTRLETHGFMGDRGSYRNRLSTEQQQNLRELDEQVSVALGRYYAAVLEAFHEVEKRYYKK